MLRIWLTEYNFLHPITKENMGTDSGPNIEAPSSALAMQIAKVKHPLLISQGLRVIGYLIQEIPTKTDIDNPNSETFIPDWDNSIDYDVIMYN